MMMVGVITEAAKRFTKHGIHEIRGGGATYHKTSSHVLVGDCFLDLTKFSFVSKSLETEIGKQKQIFLTKKNSSNRRSNPQPNPSQMPCPLVLEQIWFRGTLGFLKFFDLIHPKKFWNMKKIKKLFSCPC